MTQIFDEEALTSNTAVTSENHFSLRGGRGDPMSIMVRIGCSGGSGNNEVTFQLFLSPNYDDVVDPDDADWIEYSKDGLPIHIVVGDDYDVGALDSGDEFQAVLPLSGQFQRAKAVIQRSGTGTKTITIDAWAC